MNLNSAKLHSFCCPIFSRSGLFDSVQEESDFFQNKFPLKFDRYLFSLQKRRVLYMTKRHYKVLRTSHVTCRQFFAGDIGAQKRRMIVLHGCQLPHGLLPFSNIQHFSLCAFQTGFLLGVNYMVNLSPG